MIPQGSNNPLVLEFDEDVSYIREFTVSLWCDRINLSGEPLKVWRSSDMDISENTAICPLSVEETASWPTGQLVVEVKGIDDHGNTVFWEECKICVHRRRDKTIEIVEMNGG